MVAVAVVNALTLRRERFDQLEQEVVALSIRLNAATYELLVLIAELDELGEWGLDGFKSCGHWLSWRVGTGLGAANEKVRVAKALKVLPKTSDALKRGAVSYSKVRAMTRIATPESEEELLNIALYGTASHVEKTVRLFRRCQALALTEASKQAEARGLRVWTDPSGMVCIEGRLAPEQGAVVQKALEALHDDAFRATRGATDAEMPSRAQRLADALTEMAQSCLAEKSAAPGDPSPYQVVVHVDADTLRHDADGRCVLEDGGALSAETARRLCCDGSVMSVHERSEGDGQVIDLGRKRRIVSRPLRRALEARDATCRFPGCESTRHLHAHRRRSTSASRRYHQFVLQILWIFHPRPSRTFWRQTSRSRALRSE